jgi:hypothetical protein
VIKTLPKYEVKYTSSKPDINEIFDGAVGIVNPKMMDDDDFVVVVFEG